jgi:hypothetical protein
MPAEFRPLNDAVVYARSSARGDLPFMVATMFTGNLRARADQLKASLEQLALNFVAYQVPAVHSSISAMGTGDIAFCKPNFISFVQREYRMPVLYVDADVVFRGMPERIVALARDGIDFAAYNWLAERNRRLRARRHLAQWHAVQGQVLSFLAQHRRARPDAADNKRRGAISWSADTAAAAGLARHRRAVSERR